MPTMKPVSELQRNMTAIEEECHVTKEPVCFTKSDSASLDIVDAETYDREMNTFKAIMRGHEDLEEGRMRSLEELDQDINRIRGKKW